jgi:hypothetical protein
VGLKLNGAYQLLAYADGVNLLGDNTVVIRKNTETVIDTIKKVGLEVNAEKTKHMLLSSHQNAGKDHDIMIAKRFFENVAQFRYLGTTVSNQKCIQEEIKRRLNSGNSVQNILPSRLLSENLNIRIYGTIVLPVVCMHMKLGL